MKRIALKAASVCAVSCLFAGTAGAATQIDTGQRESLAKSDNLFPLVVGFDVEEESNRDVEWDGGGSGEFGSRSYVAHVGFGVLPWLNVFGTVGQVEAKTEGDYGDGEMRWSLGASANLFQYDIVDPEFLEGRLSFRAEAEMIRADFEADEQGGEWRELAAAATVNYEIFVDRVDTTDRVPYSLAIFAGPAYSNIDGEIDGGGDFESDTEWGLAFGADLFVSHNLSLGLHVERFNDYGYRAGFRYRF